MVVDRFPPKHGAVAVACGEQRAAEPTGYANSISQPHSPNNRKLFAIWLAWHEAVSAGERTFRRRLTSYAKIPQLARPRPSWTTASSTDAESRFP